MKMLILIIPVSIRLSGALLAGISIALAMVPNAAPIPWVLDQEHTFNWISERQKDGVTKFRLTDLAASKENNPMPSARYRLTSEWQFTAPGSSRKKELEVFLAADWSVLRFRSSEHFSGIDNKRANPVIEGAKEGDKLVLRSSEFKGKASEGKPTYEMDLPRDALIMPPQAIELWAVFLGQLGTARLEEKNKQFPIAYPEFGKTFLVQFQLEDDKPLEFPGQDPIPCKHYSFKSQDKQLQGELWLDKESRLIRYQQGKRTVQLEIPTKK